MRDVTYNDAGRMATMTVAGVTTTLTYNALGQRVRKSNGSGTTVFVYDEGGRLLGEYSSAGGLIAEYVWLDDIPLATLRPNGGGVDVFYIHSDHLNAPRKVTGPSDKALRWTWDPDAFGNGAPNANPSGLEAFILNLRFPGQYFDAETGLHYNYFRDYDPAIGRYVQSDPIGLAGGINTYGYATANPILRFDSNGLTTISVDVSRGTMIVDPEVRGRAPYTMPVSSGRDECTNNVKCSSDANRGPIPPGSYSIAASAISDPGIVHDMLRQFRGDWGDWRVPVRPRSTTRTYGRSGFYLHGGSLRGSAGCIDIGGGTFGNSLTDRLREDLMNDPDGIVPVVVH